MYKLNYDTETGKVESIQKDNMTIPICEGNIDYQEFLEWNKEQKIPLDINSSLKIDYEARRLAQVEAQRKSAYQAEADPLFFKAQRGEIDKQVWLDKVTEIKKRIQ